MFAIDKKRLWLPLAGAAAVLTGSVIWLFLHHLESTYQEAGELVPVLVATHSIPRGIPLDPSYFQMSRIPKAYAEPGAISDFSVLVSSPGRPNFRSLISIPEGTQLAQREIVSITQGDALSQFVPENKVAVSFGVDRVHGVGGNVQPGDLIDILHTPKEKEMAPGARQTASLFQAVPVIAVGKKWATPPALNEESDKSAEEKEKQPEKEDEDLIVLTVSLNPVAAMRLAEVRENEVLSVLLRSPGDTHILEGLAQ